MADSDVRPALSKSDALSFISSYLPREWSTLTLDQITVKQITGGYLNTVNLVTRSTESVDEPNEVIVHKSGGGLKPEKNKDTQFSSRMEEVMVFYESSKLGVAPKLYGISDEATLQEYINGHTLTPDECCNKNILTIIGQAYAKFHTIQLPIDNYKYIRGRSTILNDIKVIDNSKDTLKQLAVDKLPHLNWDEIFELSLLEEINWATNLIDKIGYRKVIITGDQNYLNVLVSDNGNRISLIDYELTRYAPRGIDLGGHFINRTIQWNNKKNKANGYEILNRDLRYHLISEYYKQIEQLSHKFENFQPDALDSVDHIMEEADIGMLIFLLDWGSRLFSRLDKFIHFENGAFASVVYHLFSLYSKLKDELSKQYPDW